MARHVRLHFRHPSGWDRLGLFVAKMRAVFDRYNARFAIGLTFETASSDSVEDLSVEVPVGTCDEVTEAAAALFRRVAPADMSEDEVAVLFPAGLIGDAKWGCAQSPVGWRGVLVSAAAPLLTLPHEIAHLFLGTGHHKSTDNLMHKDPAALTSDPPALNPAQAEKMAEGQWALPLGMPPLTISGLAEAPGAMRDLPRGARTRDRGLGEARRPAKNKKAAKRTRKPAIKAAKKKRATIDGARGRATAGKRKSRKRVGSKG